MRQRSQCAITVSNEICGDCFALYAHISYSVSHRTTFALQRINLCVFCMCECLYLCEREGEYARRQQETIRMQKSGFYFMWQYKHSLSPVITYNHFFHFSLFVCIHYNFRRSCHIRLWTFSSREPCRGIFFGQSIKSLLVNGFLC